MNELFENWMDTTLVHQKDCILALVNRGLYSEASHCLAILEPLWEAMGYAYKTREIKERIRKEQE